MKKRNQIKYLVAVFIAVLFPFAAQAHHSDSALDMVSIVALEGTVTEFRWRNPHVYISIDSVSEQGDAVEWNIQAGAVSLMSRMGWTSDSIAVGEYLEAEVHPARNGQPYGFLASITREDGTPISASFDSVTGEPDQAVARSTEIATSIEGVWRVDSTDLVSYPGGSEGYFMANLQPTEKGRQAQLSYDENSAENPVTQCIGVPAPYMTVLATIFPLEIKFNEDENTVSIRSGAFDYHQTVYLDGREHPVSGDRSFAGHAIGWWEDDTLVVDTVDFADHRDAYQFGLPAGAEKHVLQRFRLMEGGTRIEVEFELEDPEYIVGSLVDKRELNYEPQSEIAPFDCDPESALRFLN